MSYEPTTNDSMFYHTLTTVLTVEFTGLCTVVEKKDNKLWVWVDERTLFVMTTLQLVLVKQAMVNDRLAGRTSVIIYHPGRFIIDSCYVFHSSICFLFWCFLQYLYKDRHNS